MFYAVFFGLSGIIGSLIGGSLIDSYGGGALYAVMGAFALAGTLLLTAYHALPSKKRLRD